jgi:hypothetical protein
VEVEEERERREEVVREGREETVEEDVDLSLPQVFAIHPHLESKEDAIVAFRR